MQHIPGFVESGCTPSPTGAPITGRTESESRVDAVLMKVDEQPARCFTRRSVLWRLCLYPTALTLWGNRRSLGQYLDRWGIIAFISGATPGQATGIPVLADHIRRHLQFKMGWGGPCLIPSPCGGNEWWKWADLIDDPPGANPLELTVFEAGEAEEQLRRRRSKQGAPGLLVLIGHSQGGNAALTIANSRGVKATTDLLICLDPYDVPGRRVRELHASVARGAFNFYTNRGPGSVHGASIPGMQNYDFTDDRCPKRDCVEGRGHQFTHTNIDDCEYIHGRVAGLVQELFPR